MTTDTTFDGCIIAFFWLGPNKEINPCKMKHIAHMTNPHDGSEFWGVVGGSKYGVQLPYEATHWGIFNISDPGNPKIIHADAIPRAPRGKTITIIEDYYATFMRTPRNVKFYMAKTMSHRVKSKTNKLKEHS